MKKFDKDALRHIESLLTSYSRYVKDAEGQKDEAQLVYGLRCLVNMAQMILRGEQIFGLEPWHAIAKGASFQDAGELLLRLKDYKGEAMPPYPFIMAFYNHGFTAQLDTILVLCAIRRFMQDPKARQISVNISARSLRDPEFVKVILPRLEALDLKSMQDAKIIFEIHESTASLAMSRQVLQLFRQVGCAFAIDDVGLSIRDVMRLGAFEGIADYIKIDRHCVCAEADAPNSLGVAMAFISDMLPRTVMIAEGVRSAKHARHIYESFPGVAYVQGLYLPHEHAAFAQEFNALID